MSRLIDADKLLKNWCESICKPRPNCSDDCIFYHEITNAPTAVIRCKDCRFYKTEDMRCCLFHALLGEYEYCSYAERRTDG